MNRLRASAGGGIVSGVSLIHPEVKYDINFATGQWFGALPSDLVVSRASDALTLTPGGTYANFASNTARITGSGLLVEEARTNLTTNSAGDGFQAGIIGSGGAVGTGWGGFTTIPVSVDVLRQETRNGITGLVLKLSGTPTTTTTLTLRCSPTAYGSIGETYTNSIFLQLDAGSLGTSTGWQLRAGSETTAGNTVATPTSTFTRFTNTRTLTQADGRCVVRFNFSDTVTPVDFTLFIGGAQSSLAGFSLSPITTTGTALTRPADNIYLPISGIGTECTVFADVDGIAGNSQSFANIFTLSADGTNNNRLSSNRANALSGGIQASNVVSGVASSIALTAATVGNNVAFKTASRYSAASIGVSLNGNTVATVSVSSAPSVSRIYFGNRPTGDNGMNGYIKRIAIIPRALSDAELQAITT